jgi:hypothetical protein
MPDSEWNGMLAAAAAEVLETMFFSSVYGPAQPGPYPPAPRVAARVGFEGTPSGVLTLGVSEAAMRGLAGNFLASDEDGPLPLPQVAGVACELANMICGSLLSRVKAERHFRLSSPELLSDDAPCLAVPADQSWSLGEDVSDGAIDLWLALEPNAD